MENKNMTKCKACGKDIAKGVKKCVHCGKDQRSFFKKHKILTGILILMLIGMMGAALGGTDEEKTPATNTNAPKTSTDAAVPELDVVAEETIYMIGDSFTAGELGVVIDSVEEKDGFTSSNQFIKDVTTEGKFIVVTAKITNNDKTARTISSMQFRLIDNQDREFDASNDMEIMMVLDDKNLFLEEVNPGMSRTGIFAFEVPTDVTEYSLEVDSGIGFAAKSSQKVKLK